MLQAHSVFDSVLGLGAAGGGRCCLVAPWWQIWEHLTRLAYSAVRNRGPRPPRYNEARLYKVNVPLLYSMLLYYYIQWLGSIIWVVACWLVGCVWVAPKLCCIAWERAATSRLFYKQAFMSRLSVTRQANRHQQDFVLRLSRTRQANRHQQDFVLRLPGTRQANRHQQDFMLWLSRTWQANRHQQDFVLWLSRTWQANRHQQHFVLRLSWTRQANRHQQHFVSRLSRTRQANRHQLAWTLKSTLT